MYCAHQFLNITCDLIKVKSLKKKQIYKTQSYLSSQNILWIFISLIESLVWETIEYTQKQSQALTGIIGQGGRGSMCT